MTMPRDVLRFGPYTLDTSRLELRRDGVRVRIQPKPLALLIHLVRNSERVVPHEEIFREVWSGVHVEPGALKSALHSLRRALAAGDPEVGSDGDGSWIVSLHGQGYRFVGPLEPAHDDLPVRSRAPLAAPAGSTARLHDFVDRETEMGRLRALCRAALGGERQIVLLGGPPGIGKTRTASEIAREAETLGFEVHVGRAHEGDGAPPFWPWAQIVRSWTQAHGTASLEALAGPGSRAADSLGLAPELEPDPTAHPSSSYAQADQARFGTLDRVTGFLTRAARGRPLLLILDDLHRADSASLELLLFLAQHVVQAPLAIVGTHRPVEPAHPLGRVLHEPGTCSIPLAGLVRGSVEDILAQTCGGKAPAELVARVHAASGGNPLFVYELARALVAGNAAGATLPSRVHDAVWARICECSPQCLELLRLASAGGPELTLPVLRAAFAGSLDAAALLDAVEEAEERDLLTCTAGTYGFVHGVVREALYEKLGPTERMQIHLRLGEALEALPGHPPPTRLAALAHHFLEGAALRGAERAVHYARRAAQAARALCAFPEEVELRRRLVRALELSPSVDPLLRGRALVEVGDALGHAAAPIAEFQEAFSRALDLAREHGAFHLVACAAERCICHMSSRGAFLPVLIPSQDQALVQTLIADLTKVQDAPEVQSDPVLHARVLLALTFALAEERPEESRRALEQSMEIASRSADLELRGELLVTRYAYVYHDLDAREAVQQDLLAWTLETRNQTFEVEAHQLAARNALERGDRAAYDRAATELERLAGLGLVSASYHVENWRFVCAQLEQPIVAASDQAQRMARAGGRLHLDPGWVLWTLGLQMGWLMLQAGMTDMLLLQAEAYADRVGHVPEIRMANAYLLAAAGRHDEARRLLDHLPRQGVGFGRGEIWIGGMTAAAEACVLSGDRERALPIFDALAPYAHRVASFVTLIFGPVSRHLGALAALLGRWDESLRLFEQAARQAQQLRSPVFATLVDADRALALRTHPDPAERERSAHLRQSAERAARDLGMHLVSTRLAQS